MSKYALQVPEANISVRGVGGGEDRYYIEGNGFMSFLIMTVHYFDINFNEFIDSNDYTCIYIT